MLLFQQSKTTLNFPVAGDTDGSGCTAYGSRALGRRLRAAAMSLARRHTEPLLPSVFNVTAQLTPPYGSLPYPDLQVGGAERAAHSADLLHTNRARQPCCQ